MQEIAASTGRQWIMLVVAIINTTVAILLIAHVMTCIWVGVGEFIQRDDHWLALAALPDDRWSEELHGVRLGFQGSLLQFRPVVFAGSRR